MDLGELYHQEMIRAYGSDEALQAEAAVLGPLFTLQLEGKLPADLSADLRDRMLRFNRAHDEADRIATGTMLMEAWTGQGLEVQAVDDQARSSPTTPGESPSELH